MNAKRTAALWAGLALSGAVAAATATPAAPAGASKSVKEIRDCMSNNLIRRAALRDLTLGVNDKEGKIRDLKLKLYWKPSGKGGTRVLLRLVEPVAMAGSSYLLIQEGANEEVFFALPGADRALRITGQNMSEPLWGTDFSYGEIKQVMGLLVAGETQKRADASAGGRSAHVLETATKVEETGYRKVVNYVDKASCVLMKSEFVAAGDKPRKVLEGDASTLLQADKYWTLLGYTMRDVSRGTYTTLALSDLTVDERMSERLFNPKEFFLPPKK